MRVFITDEEKQMLRALADGATVSGLNPYLDITYKDWKLRDAVDLIRAKLGAVSITNAVAIAIREQIIT